MRASSRPTVSFLKPLFFAVRFRFRHYATDPPSTGDITWLSPPCPFLSSFGQMWASPSPPTQYCERLLRLTFALSLLSYFYWHALDMYPVTREGRGMIHPNYTQSSAVSEVLLHPGTHYSTVKTIIFSLQSSLGLADISRHVVSSVTMLCRACAAAGHSQTEGASAFQSL